MSERRCWTQCAYESAMTLLRGREGVCQTLSTDQQRLVWELSETELLGDAGGSVVHYGLATPLRPSRPCS